MSQVVEEAQVVFPLSTLLESPGDLLVEITQLAFEESKTSLVPFITMPEEESERQTDNREHSEGVKKAKRTKKTAEPSELSVRQAFQEMRAMGEDVTCESLLSDGQRVGDFLLKQWLAKEGRKK